jgi:hypothetical protein
MNANETFYSIQENWALHVDTPANVCIVVTKNILPFLFVHDFEIYARKLIRQQTTVWHFRDLQGRKQSATNTHQVAKCLSTVDQCLQVTLNESSIWDTQSNSWPSPVNSPDHEWARVVRLYNQQTQPIYQMGRAGVEIGLFGVTEWLNPTLSLGRN